MILPNHCAILQKLVEDLGAPARGQRSQASHHRTLSVRKDGEGFFVLDYNRAAIDCDQTILLQPGERS